MTRELTKREVRVLGVRRHNLKYTNGFMISGAVSIVLCGIIVLIMYAMDILPYNGNIPNPDWNALICMSPILVWMLFFVLPFGINQEIYAQKYIIKWVENGKELPDDNVDIEKD